MFLERLYPLEEERVASDEVSRHNWVRDLLNALSHLEELGFTHGDVAIRNLGIDSSKHLKLFDFGSSISRDHYDYAAEVKRDHFGLATCLHYILTGNDLFADVKSGEEARQVECRLREGRGIIGVGAEVLRDVIQDGWTGNFESIKFSRGREIVEGGIGAVDSRNVSGGLTTSEEYYQQLESRSVEWLSGVELDERWMGPEDYCAACVAKAYDVDIDAWR